MGGRERERVRERGEGGGRKRESMGKRGREREGGRKREREMRESFNIKVIKGVGCCASRLKK